MANEEDGYLSGVAEPPTTKRMRCKAEELELFQCFSDVPAFKAWIENQQRTIDLLKGDLAEGEWWRRYCTYVDSSGYIDANKNCKLCSIGEKLAFRCVDGKEHGHLNRATEGSTSGLEGANYRMQLETATKAVIQRGLSN